MSRRNNQGTTARRHRTNGTVQPVTEIQDIIIRVEMQLKINQSENKNVHRKVPHTTTATTCVTHPNQHSVEHSHVWHCANAHWDARREFEQCHPSWGPRKRPNGNGNRRTGNRGRTNGGQCRHANNSGRSHWHSGIHDCQT